MVSVIRLGMSSSRPTRYVDGSNSSLGSGEDVVGISQVRTADFSQNVSTMSDLICA